MNILIVGNVTKDVYLNLDEKKDSFETDNDNVKWLNLGFDSSSHHFKSHSENLGGAAIPLKILQKLKFKAQISGSHLDFSSSEAPDPDVSSQRFILTTSGGVSYFSPSVAPSSTLIAPKSPIDYLYLDRSAKVSTTVSEQISDYLDSHPSTNLVVYLKNADDRRLDPLVSRASLVFLETKGQAVIPQALKSLGVDKSKVIFLSAKSFTFSDIKETVYSYRISNTNLLYTYSAATATIFGSFLLGLSVEDSLKFARLNIENLRPGFALTLKDYKKFTKDTNESSELPRLAADLVRSPLGILAADESGGSMHKKLSSLNIPDTYENRQFFRNLLFSTPDLEKYISGVILFDETARGENFEGENIVKYLENRHIIPGIKVDQGLEYFPDSPETYTKGIKNLASRLQEYYQMGLRFAKWRACLEIRLDSNRHLISPTRHAVEENCKLLAEYASLCQKNGLVPIVEPEVVYDGDYPLGTAAYVSGKVLDCLFAHLKKLDVDLSACILKTNMVLPGKKYNHPYELSTISEKTAEILKKHVPKSIAGVVFLSGGQTPEQATKNLAAIIKCGPYPWPVTFSFSRALQNPALEAWAGLPENGDAAREAFLDRLKANQEAIKK